VAILVLIAYFFTVPTVIAQAADKAATTYAEDERGLQQ
jgi:hypothetical protein